MFVGFFCFYLCFVLYVNADYACFAVCFVPAPLAAERKKENEKKIEMATHCWPVTLQTIHLDSWAVCLAVQRRSTCHLWWYMCWGWITSGFCSCPVRVCWELCPLSFLWTHPTEHTGSFFLALLFYVLTYRGLFYPCLRELRWHTKSQLLCNGYCLTVTQPPNISIAVWEKTKQLSQYNDTTIKQKKIIRNPKGFSTACPNFQFDS